MSDVSPELSDVSPKGKVMSICATLEAHGHVRSLISEYPAGTPLKAVFPQVARRLGVSTRRVLAFWHREARQVPAEEMDALREAVKRRKINATNEAMNDAATLERAADALASVDPDFHRADVDRLRSAARDIRRALGQGRDGEA